MLMARSTHKTVCPHACPDWWSKQHSGGGGVNQIASQRVTDLGAWSTLHENLVNVETAHA
jgi:hypothetical protein